MVKVLQNWQEIGEATLGLQRQGLPTHMTVSKNWDQYLLYKTLENRDRGIRILDLGCGDGYTLKLLHALGFNNVHGLDFTLSRKLRLGQFAKMWRQKTLTPPYHLHKGDITNTGFEDASVDVAFSLSVIEHGVNIEALFKEAQRILKPQGQLFLTTDYWEEKIADGNTVEAFGLPWKVFSRDEVESLIRLARRYNFLIDGESAVLSCSDRTVYWQNTNYTFIQLQFVKA